MSSGPCCSSPSGSCYWGSQVCSSFLLGELQTQGPGCWTRLGVGCPPQGWDEQPAGVPWPEQRGVFELVGLAPASLVETALCGRALGSLSSVLWPWQGACLGLLGSEEPLPRLSVLPCLPPLRDSRDRAACKSWHHSALPAMPAFSASAGHSGWGTAGPSQPVGAPCSQRACGQGLMGPALPLELRPQTEPCGLWQVAPRRSKPAPYVYIVTRVGGQLQPWQLSLCAKHSPTPLAPVNTGWMNE